MQAPPLLAAENLLDHVIAHPVLDAEWFLGNVLGWINNHILMALISAILVLLVFFYVASRIQPRGQGAEAHVTRGPVAQLFESILLFLRDQMARPQLGHLTDKYIPYIWTVFFFVLFCNLLGLIPLGAIAGLVTQNKHYSHAIGGTATGNLAITGAMALLSLIAIIFIGVKEQGTHYFAHFSPGPIWMAPLLVPLEVMGLFIKCCVLALRLFGNMLAGHLVIAALLGLIITAGQSYGATGQIGVGIPVILGAVAISLLELFVAFLQAFIFTFLTVLFIAAGAAHGHHDQHHDYDQDHDNELEHGVEPVAGGALPHHGQATAHAAA